MNTLHIVTLLSAPGVGRRTVQQLLNADLAFVPSRPQELRDLLLERSRTHAPRMRVPSDAELEKAYNDAERLLESAENQGVQVLGPDSQDFPEQLRDIPDPPVVLYVRGNVHCLAARSAVAVIGTREPSHFGAAAAGRLAATLADKGIVVVSGLALGCDTAAHTGCLETGGKTVAVMAHGLDQVYPSQNRALAERILDSDGCLVSEYPPGVRPRGNFFVERDRLQSGLSAAVIIVETDIKGGTMHTARFCLEQQRLLGCLVHPPKFADHPKARGNRQLIAEEKAFALATKADVDEFVAVFHKPVPAPQVTGPDESVEQPPKRDEQLSFYPEWTG